MNRAADPDIRNPVRALPAAERLAELPVDSQVALRHVLIDLSKDARARAEHSWRTGKGPMAAYWRAVAVYSRHISGCIRRELVSRRLL